MHELLAALVYVFYTDYHLVHDVVTSHYHETHSVLSIEHLEHDLYWCYIALMTKTRPYFATDTVAKDTPKTESEIQQLFKPEPNKPSTFIVHTLEELQSVTLKRFDQELQQHLQKFGIQPQVCVLEFWDRNYPLEFRFNKACVSVIRSQVDETPLWSGIFPEEPTDTMGFPICQSRLSRDG
eukprot:sb/3471664/